ncbi:unnamed protein product [Schistosoma mattheei]|uniref:Uncharacterized protein n=1 Tax=Schistosoma mattheei TaxID=31246 RepID=A0A3P8GFV5_9TREM|nr:unnamed protein product [Schistosoma mattheei]
MLKIWGKLHPIINNQENDEQSSLSILKAGLEDGDEIVCSVSNAATQINHDPMKRNLSITITVEVHTPMNPPDIEAAHTDLPIDVKPPTTEETRIPIRQIKSGKAAGPDNIPAIALKPDIEVTTNMLYLLFQKIWEKEQVPME